MPIGAHPYIPNSVPAVRQAMLNAVGAHQASDLFASVPTELQVTGSLAIPPALVSEHDLQQHLERLLADVAGTNTLVSFLGGGAARHFVPALCDEIASRREFLTAYAGEGYSDHGKHQAWFEYQSLMAELLDMDFVSFPTYDWMAATSSAMLMAVRATGRSRLLVPDSMHPERRSHLHNFCRAGADRIEAVAFDPWNGGIDLEDLAGRLGDDLAALYVETPNYFGSVEVRLPEIVEAVHAVGAKCVVGVDPISLGVLAPPSAHGADIVVGDAQSLGLHLQAGGATCGFIASSQDPALVREYPTLLESITTTSHPDVWGFGWTSLDQTSFGKRDASDDITGTTSGLWAITAAVYLSSMGPAGMQEVGATIMSKSRYLAGRLVTLPGVEIGPTSVPFKELVVRFDDTGLSVVEINNRLLEQGILGGHDLSTEFPQLGQSALYCVTEVTPQEHIDRLVDALAELLR